VLAVLTRQSIPELQIRADGDGRTIHGLLVPYGTSTEIREAGGSYRESFAFGAFSSLVGNPAQRGRIKLLSQHSRTSNPLGRATELAEDRAGLTGAFRVSQTAAGDEVLELVRDGALDSFSIGFEPITDEWNKRRTEVVRRRARLHEVSLVTFGAYEGAQVAGVRSASDLEDEARARSRSRLALALTRSKSA